MRAVRIALRCNALLDVASMSTPPRPHCRAFHTSDESYAMHLGAATHGEARTAQQCGGVRTSKGTRTLMSNARVQRGRARYSDADEHRASRPPLQRIVRRFIY